MRRNQPRCQKADTRAVQDTLTQPARTKERDHTEEPTAIGFSVRSRRVRPNANTHELSCYDSP